MRSLHIYQSTDLKKHCISEEVDLKESDNIGSEHVSMRVNSECETEDENVKTMSLRRVMGMVNRN
jgi:hypothetical protein